VSLATKAEKEEDETLSTMASADSTKSQSYAAMINHMFTKATICYRKAALIFKSHPRAVGDCLYSTGLLFKHHMKLASVKALKSDSYRHFNTLSKRLISTKRELVPRTSSAPIVSRKWERFASYKRNTRKPSST
jgi:hypothetical protein